MCNALVEELCLFVSDCLRVLQVKRENPLRFFVCSFFKSICSGTLNIRGGEKRIPVFVSKFGKLFLISFFFFCFYLLFFFLFLRKASFVFNMWEG